MINLVNLAGVVDKLQSSPLAEYKEVLCTIGFTNTWKIFSDIRGV